MTSRVESLIARNIARGDGRTAHPLHSTWNSMKGRCLRPNHPDFPNYGGRGIFINAEWIDDPFAFYSWIDKNLGPRPVNCQLDRIDNDGWYEPGNLRWANKSEQMLNRRAFVTNARARIAELEAEVAALRARLGE